MKKVVMNGKLQNMTTVSDYLRSPNAFTVNDTVIDMGDGTMLPLISQAGYERNEVGIAINPNSFINRFNPPKERDMDSYNIAVQTEAHSVIDFSDCKNYHDVINKQKALKDVRSELMTNADHISYYPIGDNNTRLMAGLKEAINAKQCDINMYEQNFDGNFLNDIRILNGDSITDKKTIKFGNALDIKVSVKFEDKNPNVPNPMGKVVEVELTGGDDNE